MIKRFFVLLKALKILPMKFQVKRRKRKNSDLYKSKEKKKNQEFGDIS